jgi:hypothetical protein
MPSEGQHGPADFPMRAERYENIQRVFGGSRWMIIDGKVGWSDANRDRDVIRTGKNLLAQAASLSFKPLSLNVRFVQRRL